MTIAEIFDLCRDNLGTRHPANDGKKVPFQNAVASFKDFCESIDPDFKAPYKSAWQNSGNFMNYLWEPLIRKDHVKEFKKEVNSIKELPFSVSIFIYKTSNQANDMAIEVSFEIVHEKCSQIAYQAFNESSLDKYPAGCNISLVGKDPFFPDSVTQDPGRAKAFLNGAVLSNKKKNNKFIKLSFVINEKKGESDQYYLDLIKPRFEELVPVYDDAYARMKNLQRPSGSAVAPEASEPDAEIVKPHDFVCPKNIILFGPPGTGKTYYSVALSAAIASKDNASIEKILNNESLDDAVYDNLKNTFADETDKPATDAKIRFTTFHQSYSYEDFIEGIFPKLDAFSLSYERKDGVFKSICDLAKQHPDDNYVMVIDEINRGNISKIFGELISLVEEDKRLGGSHELKAVLPYSHESWGIPSNVYIVGTMNTADRSIERIDTALRRRFSFVEMMPKPDLVSGLFLENGTDKIWLKEILRAINERICYLQGREHQLGHAYLMNIPSSNGKVDINDLAYAFANKIIPLLQEYFYDDYGRIRLVLGEYGDSDPATDAIVGLDDQQLPYVNKSEFDDDDDLRQYEVNLKALTNIEFYKKIIKQ